MSKTKHTGPKILFVDVETRPMLGYFFGIWDQNIGTNQIEEGEDTEIIAWGAKWAHDDKMYYSDLRDGKSYKKFMQPIWDLLNAADVVVWYNGDKFDFKHLNTAFVIGADLKLPNSYTKFDALKCVRKHFAFPSYKLEYVAKRFKCKHQKSKHKKFPGMDLWIQCLKDNKEAWKEMEEYNKKDVLVLEEVYYKLIPYDSSINFSVFNEDQKHVCSCGSTQLSKNGLKRLQNGVYQRYTCKKCGKESRGKENLMSTEVRKELKVGVKR